MLYLFSCIYSNYQLHLKSRKPCVVDPLTDDEKLQSLAAETERLSKVVEGLDRRSLNGPTNLELKWKEMVEAMVSLT